MKVAVTVIYGLCVAHAVRQAVHCTRRLPDYFVEDRRKLFNKPSVEMGGL